MKQCIIGFPRSRSSILLETISIHYKIPILGEDINELTNRKTLSKHPSSGIYKSLLRNIIRSNDGVLRLHPLQISRPNWKEVSFDLFNFEQYDKIYFTFRESVSDILGSEFVAKQIGKFTYQSEDEIVKNVPEMTFNDTKLVEEHVFSENLVKNLKEYLDNNSLKYTELFYNDIPKYIELNFPNTKSSHIETKYDYQKIIKNYDDINLMYTELRKENV